MDKEDGRKLTRQAQHKRRKQAVRLHRQSMGFKALAPKPTGRAAGQKRRLTAEQELHIQRLICKNRPEQLKLTFALWSCGAVAGATRVWHRVADPQHGRVPQALGLHPAKAHHPGLRTASRGRQGVAERAIPGHCRARQA